VLALLTGARLWGAGPEWDMDQGPGEDEVIEITDGVVTLDWIHDERSVELRHRKPNGRESIQDVTGDTRTVQSGLADGLHRFQLRADGGEWGDLLKVRNTYMEKSRVVWLLVSGGIVVTAIVVAILYGSFSQNRKQC